MDTVGLRYAFVGGSIVDLLLDIPDLGPSRPTDDVDVIIEITAGERLSAIEEKLRTAGFQHDMRPGSPKCRWCLSAVTVDIMPTDGAELGLNTQWFAEALATAELKTVAHSLFLLISPVAFLATKYVAFRDRGKNRQGQYDYYASHDLEDFMTVIDGRAAIAAEIDQAPAALRRFVIESIRSLLSSPELVEALPGYVELPGRARLLREKLDASASLADSRTLA
jgi:hypothetical protein